MTPAELREAVARAIRDAGIATPETLADAVLAVVREAMREPDAGMLDRGVAFALNVQISGEYGWTPYICDLWTHMLAASPLRDAP